MQLPKFAFAAVFFTSSSRILLLLVLIVTAWAVPASPATLVFEDPPGTIDPSTGIYTQDGFIVYSRGGSPPFIPAYPGGNLAFRQGIGVPEINEVLIIREDFALT